MAGTNNPSMNWQVADLDKEWKRFKQHCDFTFLGPLSGKTEVQKVNYLMTYIGDKGREIYQTFTWRAATEDQPAENDTLEGVYQKYSTYVAPKKNQIRATVNFNRRKQEATEKFDNFVTDLRLLVQDCGYADQERMLRDAIVLRSLHAAVREKCLDKGDELTLETAITIGQNHETSQESLKIITDEDPSVNKIHSRKHDRFKKTRHSSKQYSKHRKEKPEQTQDTEKCGRCGYHRSHRKCPAKHKECNVCHKFGHFGTMCRNSGKAHAIREEELETESETDSSEYEEDIAHLINKVTDGSEDEWFEHIKVNGQTLKFQIDTGANRCIIPYEVYQKMNIKRPLMKADRKFKSFTHHPIPIEGCVTLKTEFKGHKIDVTYYIAHVKQEPLLSGSASQKLGLIQRIHKVNGGIEQYPELKKTTSTLPGTYSLKIDPSVKPTVHGPRRQPKALVEKITLKLNEMEDAGHICKVTEPTDWVSSMVTVLKKGKVRICIDPTDLNKAIRREHYPIPTVEEVVSLFPNAKVFSVLDAKSGYLQIKIDYESSLLTTFNTPVGRYRWLRLPFGIKSAPEIFQRIMDTMLEGIQGAQAIMDDILIGGKDDEEHDRIMKQVVSRATEYNLGLNFEKCHVKQSRVKYSGHIITGNGLEPDPEKVRALYDMPTPESKEDVRRFLGLIQYLGKFVPNLSEVDEPLRAIIKKDVEFFWSKPAEASFKKLKELCSSAPVLVRYDGNKPLTIQCDASSYAIGGVLLQDKQPVAYTSRALTSTEKNYAQIEKEMLAIVHCCKKFHFYIFGRSITVESDHKPLQSICNKPLLAAPMRLQTMLLRLQPYDLSVTYKPGKEIPIGDALSRANLPDTEPDIEPVLINMIDFIAVTPSKYKIFQQNTANELNELHSMIQKGWPDTKQETPHCIRQYWTSRDELSVLDGVIYKGMRIVVPPSMRKDMLTQIHGSHMGTTKCKQRAREALYWPGMSQQIEDLVNDCPECNEYQNKQHGETLKQTKVPDLPWSELASDLFEWKGKQYLLTVDYYSKFIEVDLLLETSSAATIEALKSQMSRHGIPELLRTDNGPQYSSQEFRLFCENYGIQHVTSSPGYPQSNGEAERAVQTVKRLWRKNDDKHLALLDYRSTPMESCGLSPSQLLMGRRPRNKLPVAVELLRPQAFDHAEIKRRLTDDKTHQRFYYDKKAGANLPPLQAGDPVRMAPMNGNRNWLPATVVNHHSSPRSYVVEHGGRKYRRNRRHLRLSTYKAQLNSPKTTHKASISTPSTNPQIPPKPQAIQPTTAGKMKRPETPKSPHSPKTSPHSPVMSTPTSSMSPQTTMTSTETTMSPPTNMPNVVTRSGRTSKPPKRLDL